VLTCEDNCYFDGKMNGNIEACKKLVLGENSEVLGIVYAGDLMVKGKISGNVVVQRKAIYCSTATFSGESLQTGFLEVVSGAILNLNKLSMQLNELDVTSFTSADEYILKTENKKKVRKKDAPLNTKANSEPDPTNNNDNTLLFQFFQNKEGEEV